MSRFVMFLIVAYMFCVFFSSGCSPNSGSDGDLKDKDNTDGDDGGTQVLPGSDCIECPPGEKGDKGDIGPQGLKGDKGDTGDSGPKGDVGECDCNYKKWTLRDRFGEIVSNFRGFGLYMPDKVTNVGPLDEGVEPLNACFIKLNNFSGTLYYSLSTGEMEQCYENVSSNNFLTTYFDNECKGDLYFPNYSNSPIAYKVDNQMMGIWGQADLVEPEVLYRLTSSGDCAEQNNTSKYSFWKLRPIPDQILNAFPNAPYTLTYE